MHNVNVRYDHLVTLFIRTLKNALNVACQGTILFSNHTDTYFSLHTLYMLTVSCQCRGQCAVGYGQWSQIAQCAILCLTCCAYFYNCTVQSIVICIVCGLFSNTPRCIQKSPMTIKAFNSIQF